MFHRRSVNNKINRLHERAFSQLLDMDNSFTFHHLNLHRLATEMYTIKNNISPCFVKSIFPIAHNTYELRYSLILGNIFAHLSMV